MKTKRIHDYMDIGNVVELKIILLMKLLSGYLAERITVQTKREKKRFTLPKYAWKFE